MLSLQFPPRLRLLVGPKALFLPLPVSASSRGNQHPVLARSGAETSAVTSLAPPPISLLIGYFKGTTSTPSLPQILGARSPGFWRLEHWVECILGARRAQVDSNPLWVKREAVNPKTWRL